MNEPIANTNDDFDFATIVVPVDYTPTLPTYDSSDVNYDN